MAGTFIDELAFGTRVDPEGVREGLSQVEGMFRKTMNSILNNFVAPLTGALAVGRLFNNYTQQADKIAKFSRSLNINAEELQVWGEAAALAGGSAQSFQNSVRMLQRRISMSGDSAGKGSDMFKKLGIDIKDASGKTKDAFQIMTELAAKADTMDKVEFAGMAQRLRIDQGTIQLLQKGSAGVKELVDEMRQFGVITEEDSKSAEEYNDAMTKFRRATQVAGAKIFSALLPPISILITSLAKLVAFLTKNKELFRGAVFAGMALVITSKLVPALNKLKKGFKSLGMEGHLGTWGKLTAIITTLYLVFDDFITWLNGGRSAFAGFWEMFGTADEVKEKLKKLKDVFDTFVKNLKTLGPAIGIIGALTSAFVTFMTIASGISKIIKLFKGLAVVQTLLGASSWSNLYLVALVAIIAALVLIVKNWDKIKEAMQNCWNAIKSTWSRFAGWFLNIWNGVGNALKSWWNGILDFFVKGWNGIGDTLRNWWQGILDFFIDGWRSMVDGLLDFIPDFVKKWFTGNKKTENSTPVSTGGGLGVFTDGTPFYNPTAAAVQGLGGYGVSNSTTNDVDVVFNVNADDPQELGAAVRQKEKSGGWFSRLFGGDDSSRTADDVAQGQYG